MGKISSLFAVLAILFAPIIGQALEINENGYMVANITDTKLFVSPFSLSSYVEIVSAKTVKTRNGHTITDVGFRLYFNEEDRAEISKVSPKTLKTVHNLYSDLKSIKDIPGIELVNQ